MTIPAANFTTVTAAILDDRALFFQFFKRCIELYEVLRRQLHPVGQLLGRQRAVRLFMHVR